MSVFANAHESADMTPEDPAVETPAMPEDETATAAVSDTETEASDVAQENADAEDLGDEQDQLGEVEEAVEMESAGLTPEAARYLNLALRRIVGKTHANKIVSTENYSSGRASQMQAKQFALESIKDTLKSFWTAIKNQLKKFYAKVKTFFIKVFSGAKKLAARAKKIQDAANDTVGTIEEKSFSFSQTKAIAVDGKYNDPTSLLKGINDIRKWIAGNITVQKADKYESAVDDASASLGKVIKNLSGTMKRGGAGTAGRALVGTAMVDNASKGLTDIGMAPLSTMSSPEAKLIEQYAGGKTSHDKVDFSAALPGGKSIVSIVSMPDPSSSKDGAEGITAITRIVKGTRLILGNDKYSPRDVTEGDVKTLTTSQIDKVCDDVIDLAETAFTYQKAWERRDKFQAKLEREIDQLINDVESDNDDSDSRTDRVIRNYAESFTAQVRRRTSFESSFISYALSTGNAFLNYSERSLSQHKSK